jgi:hypothetical protein
MKFLKPIRDNVKDSAIATETAAADLPSEETTMSTGGKAVQLS